MPSEAGVMPAHRSRRLPGVPRAARDQRRRSRQPAASRDGKLPQRPAPVSPRRRQDPQLARIGEAGGRPGVRWRGAPGRAPRSRTAARPRTDTPGHGAPGHRACRINVTAQSRIGKVIMLRRPIGARVWSGFCQVGAHKTIPGPRTARCVGTTWPDTCWTVSTMKAVAHESSCTR